MKTFVNLYKWLFASISVFAFSAVLCAMAPMTANAQSVPPSVVAQPNNQTVAPGGTATFSVTATGSPDLQYLWFIRPATLIASSANPTLTLSNVQPSAAGNYFAVVI